MLISSKNKILLTVIDGCCVLRQSNDGFCRTFDRVVVSARLFALRVNGASILGKCTLMPSLEATGAILINSVGILGLSGNSIGV